MADKTKYNYKTFRPTEINLGNKVTSSLAEDRTKITYTIPSGWNYISFPYHLDSYLISNIIPPNVYPQLTQIQDAGFGDSNASLIVNGAWLGSITSIENKKGYKLYNEGPEIEFVIETPNGWGCLYGDTDLKWDLAGTNNLVAPPYLEDTNIADSFAFSNGSVALLGGSTGQLLDGVIGDGEAMAWVNGNWEGSIAQSGFKSRKSYYLDVKTQPATEPFRYFKDPTPSIQHWDGTNHPIMGDKQYFHFYMGYISYQRVIASAMLYIKKEDGSFEQPIANQDWIGAYRGDMCIGSSYIITDNWTYNSNYTMQAWGTDLYNNGNVAVTVCCQHTAGGNIANGKDGDMPRFVFWSSLYQKYYICKWYDTSLQRTLEWLDPLGDGSYTDVGAYLGHTEQSPNINNGNNNHKFSGVGNNGFWPQHQRFCLVALDPLSNNW